MPKAKKLAVNKYLITDDKGDLTLINAPDRLTALNMLKSIIKESTFEEANFRIDKIDAEIKEDGKAIIYTEREKDGAGSN